MLAETNLVSIRAYKAEEDKPFVLSSWLKGLRWGNHWFSLIDQTAYFKAYHAILEDLLERANTCILVACLQDSPDVILGYSVFSYTEQGDVAFHWIFVKRRWRNIGVAKMLTPPGIVIATHLTELGEKLIKKRPEIKFNPFVL